MNIKTIIRKYKISYWVKGILFTFVGLFNNRFDVSYDSLILNLIFSSIIYLLVFISGILVASFLKLPSNKIKNTLIKKKKIKIISIAIFLIAYSMAAFIVFIYKRSIISLIILGIIGSFLFINVLYGDGIYKNRIILIYIIISLTVSYGIIYGAVLNDISIPIYIYFFFLSAFINLFIIYILNNFNDSFKEKDKNENKISYIEIISLKNPKKTILILQILIIISLIIPFFIGIHNYFLYLFPMLIASLFIGLGTYYNYTHDFKTKNIAKIYSYCKKSTYFMIIAFLFASI